MGASEIDELLEKIYAGPLHLSAWAETVDRVARHVSAATGGQFHIFDLQCRRMIYSCMPWWIPREKEIEYNEQHAASDPRRMLIENVPPGAWQYDQDHFDSRFVSRSGTFQFLVRHEIRYSALAHLHGYDNVSVGFGILRAPCQKPFGPDEQAALSRLSPHLVRAAALTIKLADLRERAALGTAGLDTLADAVALVDARARIRFQNRSAGRLFMDGHAVAETGGFLRCVNADDDGTLKRAVAAAAERNVGAVLVIRNRHGQPALTCRLLALPPAGPLPEQGGHRGVLLVFRRVDEKAALLCDASTLFGLTPAEKRVAEVVAAGSTPAEAAAVLNVSVATVRSHLRQLFHKTNTRRQPELAAALRSTGLARDP